jgi:hypothetical protein
VYICALIARRDGERSIGAVKAGRMEFEAWQRLPYGLEKAWPSNSGAAKPPRRTRAGYSAEHLQSRWLAISAVAQSETSNQEDV